MNTIKNLPCKESINLNDDGFIIWKDGVEQTNSTISVEVSKDFSWKMNRTEYLLFILCVLMIPYTIMFSSLFWTGVYVGITLGVISYFGMINVNATITGENLDSEPKNPTIEE